MRARCAMCQQGYRCSRRREDPAGARPRLPTAVLAGRSILASALEWAALSLGLVAILAIAVAWIYLLALGGRP